MPELEPGKRSPLREKPLRQAGQSAQEKIDDLADNVYVDNLVLMVITGVMLMTSLMQYFLPASDLSFVIIFSLFFIGSCIYAIPKMRKAIKEVRSYKLGRDGERIVSENLEPLQQAGNYVLHDLVGGNFNLDHVVIAPQGVFVIETKTRSKREGNPKVTFDGETLLIDGMKPLDDPLTQARANAKWLKTLLKDSTGKDYPVKPVVAFPGWWVEIDPKAKRGEVWVLEPKMLPGFIRQDGVKLGVSEVNMANFHLRRFVKSG